MALTYTSSQELEATQLIHDLLVNKNVDQMAFFTHIERYTTSVILTSIYGIRVTTPSDSIVSQITVIMDEFSETTRPGAFVTSRFPWLTYLPPLLQWCRPRALGYLQRQRDLCMSLLAELKAKMLADQAPSCFARDFLTQVSPSDGIDDEQIAFLAGTMIEAGSETTASALKTDRLPSFTDLNELPLIAAIVKETFRIRPLTRYSTPHYTLDATKYQRRVIPKNTHIVLNQPALHMDPVYYAEPEVFAPTRFLGHRQSAAYYAVHPDPGTRDHYNFGAGRRICPGIHLAENSMAIVLAKLLWAFEILPPADTQTVDTSDAAFRSGANTSPKPFCVQFAVRSARRAQIIQREWALAQEYGYKIRGLTVDVDGVVVPSTSPSSS